MGAFGMLWRDGEHDRPSIGDGKQRQMLLTGQQYYAPQQKHKIQIGHIGQDKIKQQMGKKDAFSKTGITIAKEERKDKKDKGIDLDMKKTKDKKDSDFEEF